MWNQRLTREHEGPLTTFSCFISERLCSGFKSHQKITVCAVTVMTWKKTNIFLGLRQCERKIKKIRHWSCASGDCQCYDSLPLVIISLNHKRAILSLWRNANHWLTFCSLFNKPQIVVSPHDFCCAQTHLEFCSLLWLPKIWQSRTELKINMCRFSGTKARIAQNAW